MKLLKENLLWTILAFVFLYSGLIVYGPLYFGGKTVFCMFCLPATGEELQFIRTNYFIRGVLSLSIALMIHAHWTRTVAILVIVAILYAPLNTVLDLIRTGEYSIIYFIIPPLSEIFPEQNALYPGLTPSSLYVSYNMLFMLFGGMTALI